MCGSRGGADAILNVLLFIPLGFGAVRAGAGAGRAAVGALLLSAVIETAQLGLAGRYAVVGDVVWNGLGGALGAVAASQAPAVRAATRRAPRRAAALLAGTAILIWGGAAWLLVPAPQHGIYYGQWTAELAGFGLYRGRVLAARVGSRAAPSWRLPDSEAARRAIADGEPVAVDLVAGPPPRDLSPIFSIYDRRQREAFLLGARGDDLVLRVRRRGAALRLDRPELRWPDALAGTEPGDTIRVVARRSGPLAFDVAMQGRERTVAAGPARGWSLLLYPATAPPGVLTALDVLWAAAGLAILGLAAALGRPRTRAAEAPGALPGPPPAP